MRFLPVILMLFFSWNLQGQTSKKDSLHRAQDSLRVVVEQRLKVYERQRRIYERMFAEDPKATIDSVVRAENKQYLEGGLVRLDRYRTNTRPDTLTEIDLSYAGLRKIPDFVYQAENVEVLVFDNNHIRKLPRRLDKLQKLKRIYWRENNLEDFWWIRIHKIHGLEKLDISNNTLSRLPVGVKNLHGLKELVLNENLFQDVPVRRLKRADFINQVSFSKIPTLKLAENSYEQLDFIKTFKANNCGLETIDPSFYQMTGLVELQLQENGLKELPEGISRLSNLKKISFYKNKLTRLPQDFFDLNPAIVDLYYNQLEVIPDEISRWDSLKILYLAHNQIYDLPESIGELTSLDEAYLHHNRLSVLPESMARLKKLKVIRVNDNYLVDFPEQFLGMKYLEDLDISNNQISTIPEGIKNLNHLKLFTYQHNPIDYNAAENRHLPAVIVEMGESGTTCIPRVYKEEVKQPASSGRY